MKCQEVQELLSAWLDRELAEEVEAALAAHLEGCEACQREVLHLRALDAALGQLTAPVPPGLAEKVAARVRPPRRLQWWQSVALAACLILGIALGGGMAKGFYTPATSATNTSGSETASLEVFHDFPQGSMGTVLASYQVDEGNGVHR
jgi:anti-sigma factor RsiW